MNMKINPKDGKPVYRQIMDQLRLMIASGRLKPGEELPTVRGLAQSLIINPNTVARAYRELEQVGVLYTRQGSGTFVATHGTPLSRETCDKLIAERIDALLGEAQQLGYTVKDITDIVKDRYRELEKIQRKEQEQKETGE
jgi:GntR family transcriptional regulator